MPDASSLTELAWAAGFFDGEGYVGYTFRWNGKRRCRRIDVQISQIDPEVLSRFRDAVGVGKVYGPYAAKGRKNPMYKYGAAKIDDVMLVLERLRPFLSSIKTKQAEEAIRLFTEWGDSDS